MDNYGNSALLQAIFWCNVPAVELMMDSVYGGNITTSSFGYNLVFEAFDGGDSTFFNFALMLVVKAKDWVVRNERVEMLRLMTKQMKTEEKKWLFAEEAAQNVMKIFDGFWVEQRVCRRDRRRLVPEHFYEAQFMFPTGNDKVN